MNLYQNQKSHSSDFSCNQNNIDSFNINVTFINNASQTANNDGLIASED